MAHTLEMADPDRSIGGAATDRAVTLRENLARYTTDAIFFVGTKQVVLPAEQPIEYAGAGVGRANSARDRFGRVPRPVDGALLLGHTGAPPAAHGWARIIERFRLPVAGLEASHRLERPTHGRLSHLMAVQAAL